MTKIHSILLAFVVLLLSSSCATTYYQVASVKSTSPMRQTADKLVYEDANCFIEYDFWAQGGNAAFTVTNKTDKDLFVHKNRCFLVVNGHAKDCDKTSEYVLSNGTALTEQLVVIPPGSYKLFGEYSILDQVFTSCDLSDKPTKRRPAKVEFTEETSPIHFTNVITYSQNEKDGTVTRVYNDFYISAFSNYSQSQFISTRSETTDCTGTTRVVYQPYYPLRAVNKFWNIYVPKGGYFY